MYIKGHMSICVSAHCLMLEVLRYIALNALNTVQINQSNVKDVEDTLYRFQSIKGYVCRGVKEVKYYE